MIIQIKKINVSRRQATIYHGELPNNSTITARFKKWKKSEVIFVYRNLSARIPKSYKSQLVVLKKGADKTHCFESYPLLAWKLSLSIVGIKDHRLHHYLKKD